MSRLSAARQPAARPTRETMRQRGAEATRALRGALNLPTDPNDASILGTAVAEAVAGEVGRNRQLADEIRRRYGELREMQGRATKRPSGGGEESPPVPIRTIPGLVIDPFEPPDPRTLVRLYGKAQLARALRGYMVDTLRLTAARIESAHPGTKPKNRGQRDALIAYIVEHTPDE